MIKKLCTLATIFPVLLLTTAQGVIGVEFEISSNSNDSNEISIQSSSTTTVTQNNTAQVTNDVTVQANTGNNTASDNNGDTTITTGNVETHVDVENSLNTSEVTTGCCTQGENTVSISNNNNSGDNAIQIDSSKTVGVTISQYASITNSIHGSSDTGNNTTHGNTGNVSISTGWIKHYDTVHNTHINNSEVSIKTGDPDWKIKISGNSNDNNKVLVTLRNDVISAVYNNADLSNTSVWDLNTGKNNAEDNTGNITIVTGSITSATSIENDGINVNTIKLDCCKKEEKPPVINPPDNPPPPTSPETPRGGDNPKINDGGNGGGGVGGPESVGEVLGAILPATGASFWLFATIANIAMFLLGLYLRLRAGRSPCYTYANR